MDEKARFKRILTVALFAGSALFWGVTLLRLRATRAPMTNELSTEKQAYVGHWRSKDRGYELQIRPDASVDYRRRSGHGTSHFGGYVTDFDSPGFHVWTFPAFHAKFEVTEPPTAGVDGRFHMTVDGIVVERAE